MRSIVDCTLPQTGTGMSLAGLAIVSIFIGAMIWRLPRAHRLRVMLAIAVPAALLVMNNQRAMAAADDCIDRSTETTEGSATTVATTTTVAGSGSTTTSSSSTTTTTTDPGTTTTTDPGTTTTTDPGTTTTDPSTSTTAPASTYTVNIAARYGVTLSISGSGWTLSTSIPAGSTTTYIGTYDTSQASNPSDPSTYTIVISRTDSASDAYFTKGDISGGTCVDGNGTALNPVNPGSGGTTWQMVKFSITCTITGNFTLGLEEPV